jgi:hypothetical protein
MARAFQFDVDTVVEQLNRILQMELAAVIYYTHYSFMIYGHARIPITSWLRDNATESLAHAQEAGQMIMRLHKRPALGIAELPTTRHNTIDEILASRGICDAPGLGGGRTFARDGANGDAERARLERYLRLRNGKIDPIWSCRFPPGRALLPSCSIRVQGSCQRQHSAAATSILISASCHFRRRSWRTCH